MLFDDKSPDEILNDSLFAAYIKMLSDPHDRFGGMLTASRLDFLLRESIGKTDDIRIPMCSHVAILNRELGEKHCRVCQKDLMIVGVGRWNDYLILRHPQCQQPICLECAKDRPDAFYLAFKHGIDRYNEAKRIAIEIADEEGFKNPEARIPFIDGMILKILDNSRM